MDPNNPGQNPGAPTPDPWAQPPAPGQPAAPGQPPYPQQPPAAPEWGAPPPGYDPTQQPGAQPPYGQPGAQPPYGQPGQPGYVQPPYGQQPWGVAAPVKKSRLPKIIVTVVGVVVVIFGLLIVASLLLPSHAGKVVFTSDAPSSDGAKTCKLGTEVTAIKMGDPVYVNIFYKDRLTDETVTLTILKDGTKLDSTPLPAAQSNGIDCLEDQSNWGEILQNQGAGSYEFQLTDSKGNVVSDGTITVNK